MKRRPSTWNFSPPCPVEWPKARHWRRIRFSPTLPEIWNPSLRPWEFPVRTCAPIPAKFRRSCRSRERAHTAFDFRERRIRRWRTLDRWKVRWATCLKNSAPNWAKRKTDEDLETHYNLGIAYREMGLLEEAISEFQKVASSVDKGPAFRYAMQCSTLLGLAFMEKGQPAIAAIWYERALKTPGLDQESILALRYDLGVAQELAGDTHAAFNSFSQVYAMNIDYRDVSERIALLGKAR